MVTIKNGSALNDNLSADDNSDYILNGFAGNDLLTGLGGNDRLYGGNGDDILNAGDGNDFLDGNGGSDTLNGGTGNDYYWIAGEFGNNIIQDSSGNDVIDLSSTNESVNVNLIGADGQNEVSNSSGSNTVNWNNNTVIESLKTGSGNDSIEGSEFNDIINSGAGNDSIEGKGGEDNLFGNDGADTLNGGEDNDNIFGGNGDDILIGGSGNDQLQGQSGNDIYEKFLGNFGLDTIQDLSGTNDALNLTEYSQNQVRMFAIDSANDADNNYDLLRINFGNDNSIFIKDYFDNSTNELSSLKAGNGLIETIEFSNQENNFASIKEALQEPRNFYVSVDGSDSNIGSLDSPFKSIQQAANIARPGDTIYIREGIYRETVTPSMSGTSEAPITFTAYNNEKVIISGADEVSGWSVNEQNQSVYETTIDWNMGSNNQVFVNGQKMIEARWPNIPDPLLQFRGDRENLAISDSGSVINEEANPGSIGTYTDADLSELHGIDLTGANIYTEPGYAWLGYKQEVTGFSEADNTLSFTLNSIDTATSNAHDPTANNTYYLTGKQELLDSNYEWFIKPGENGQNTLYLQLPSTDSPSDDSVEVQRRETGMNLNSRAHINVNGIDFFASRLVTDNSSNNININDIESKYAPSTGGIHLGGSFNSLTNSHISNAYSGMSISGNNHNVQNNIIHDTDRYSAAINAGGENHIISNNTVFNTGGGAISIKGQSSEVSFNHVYNGGISSVTDIALINSWNGGDGQGTEINNNIVHDAVGYRNIEGDNEFYGMAGIRLDSGGAVLGTSNFALHHNVVWGTTNQGIALWALSPGQLNYGDSKIQAFNNTVDGSIVSSYGVSAAGTAIYNNILTGNIGLNGQETVYGNQENTPLQSFIDPLNGNYRLNSEILGTKGAYADGNWLAGANINNETINGTADNDYLFGGYGNDTLRGGAGDDTYIGFSTGAIGSDIIEDISGKDTLDLWSFVQADTDRFLWQAIDSNNDDKFDSLSVSFGTNNQLTVKNYFDNSTSSISSLKAGTGYMERIILRDDLNVNLSDVKNLLNSITGTALNDSFNGSNRNDFMSGGNGDDRLYGKDGNDLIFGNEGNDLLFGENGNDRLAGGNGNDFIAGGSGDDFLIGGSGNDSLLGDVGNDTYSFNELFGDDSIMDSGGNDILDLSDYSLTDIQSWQAFDRSGDTDNNVDSLRLNFLDGSSLTINGYFANNNPDDDLSFLGNGGIESMIFSDDSAVNFAKIQGFIIG